MKTLWFKILTLFFALGVFENIAFPVMANHGRFDIRNGSLQPYLLSALALLTGIFCLILLIVKKPLPKTFLYNFGKLVMSLVIVLMVKNALWLAPVTWTFFSTIVFMLHIFGILIALTLCVNLFLNRSFS